MISLCLLNDYKDIKDCVYKGEHYSVRDNGIIRKLAAYVILDINTEGKKEVLTINVGDNESWDLCFVIILLLQTVVRTLSRQLFFYTIRYFFLLFLYISRQQKNP